MNSRTPPFFLALHGPTIHLPKTSRHQFGETKTRRLIFKWLHGSWDRSSAKSFFRPRHHAHPAPTPIAFRRVYEYFWKWTEIRKMSERLHRNRLHHRPRIGPLFDSLSFILQSKNIFTRIRTNDPSRHLKKRGCLIRSTTHTLSEK